MVRIRNRRGLFVAVATALGALLVAGCSSGSAGAHGKTAAGPAAVSTSSGNDIAALSAKADTEGKVVWWSTVKANALPAIVAAFQKDYPKISLEAIHIGGSDLLARMSTEQRGHKFSVDVVNSDGSVGNQLINAGLLTPYTPPEQAPLPTGLKMPTGYPGVSAILTAVIAYDPTVLKADNLQPPMSWEDLTKPEWKGKFSIKPDAVDWYQMLIAGMGHDKALSLVKSLGANAPRLVESTSLGASDVEAGDPPVAAVVYGSTILPLEQKSPDRIKFVNPSPLLAEPQMINIAKNAPHPAAARLFENWLLSKDGQAAYVKNAGYASLRSDAGDDPSLFVPETTTVKWADLGVSDAQYNAYAQELKSAVGAP